MLVLRVSTRYAIASAGAVRPGTIGLLFSAAGPATWTSALVGPDGLKAYDTVTATVVAGQEIETGPLFSVGTLPAGTLATVGR